MPATALRPSHAARSLAPPEVRERWVLRRVIVSWCLLYLNVATFYGGSALHIPSTLGKVITQSALPAAILVALTVNRKLTVRPNIYLCLLIVLTLETIVGCLETSHFGTIYRTVRLAEFVAALWLLTPWWGRRDLLLVRAHLTALSWLLGSTLLGFLIFPGHAFDGGRLSGVIWPIPPPQVAHYAATAAGLVVVLWFGGMLRGKVTLYTAGAAVVMLILTHTRTALIGMIAGILVAGLSLITVKPRVRKFFASAGAVAGVSIITVSSFLTTWLARGEGANQISSLTGRTNVWDPLLSYPRTRFQELFGFGLSNSSFNGLAIDSNWLSAYQEQGILADFLSGGILLFLLVVAYFQPRGVKRALALFLIVYCLIASFTEDGFTDATSYMLDLTLAASLIVPANLTS